MGIKAWASEMARYNQWQNKVLFSLCSTQLDDASRKATRGMFFDSIHHTLDHILMVDTRLITMIRSNAAHPDPFAPAQQVYDDFSRLAAERHATDAQIVTMTHEVDDTWWENEGEFGSPLTGQTRKLPRHFYMAQLFNHATHHRAQVTSELHRLGIDYGSTDMPMNPVTQYSGE